LNLYLAKLGSYFEFALFCNGFTLVPTAHATLDVWIVIYVYICNWNICVWKPWHGHCVFYTLLIEPSEGFWTLTMTVTVFYVKLFLCKNLKELGVLWVWVKIFLIETEGMADRRAGKEEAISKSKLYSCGLWRWPKCEHMLQYRVKSTYDIVWKIYAIFEESSMKHYHTWIEW
jgi:hypothetical protein